MKKYKLIKEYPGSPKLGTVINVLNEEGYTSVAVGHNIYPKRHPEFWEEVVEKDYEILSFTDKKDSNCIVNVYKIGSKEQQEFSIKNILNNGLWNIHSVKRLSDGEVFTVGDVVTEKLSNNHNVTIKSIYIHLNKIVIAVNKGSLNTTVYLSLLEKPKQLLFTTEDGVDIYKGDKAWSIYIPEMIMFHQEVKLYNSTDIHTHHKYFSTKEAAEEYILMNKPCLSIQDVLVNYCWCGADFKKSLKDFKIELKSLVKSRL